MVLKLGGKLLKTADCIKRAAAYIINVKSLGDEPVVVVSALGETTDHYLSLAKQVARDPDARELDMLLSVGERESMSLLAMAINDTGHYKAVSYTGSQVGIITDTQHTCAQIVEVKALRIREALQRGDIPIVAGFQGISTDREITTLGRGGSDATAISLASAIDAKRCELVKEKGAIYSADPELIAEAFPLPEVNYSTLSVIAKAGASVVQPEASSIAERLKVPLRITGIDGSVGTVVHADLNGNGKIAAIILNDSLFFYELTDIDDNMRLSDDTVLFDFTQGFTINRGLRQESRINATTVSLVSIICWESKFLGEVANFIYDRLQNTDLTPLSITGFDTAIRMIFSKETGTQALRTIHKMCMEDGILSES